MDKSRKTMGPRTAGGVVFLSSGAVLMLEILSLRLVAPYLGLTLETSTAVIGFALAAISLGAWAGGRLADRVSPAAMIGPAVLIAGALVLFVGPVVTWTGQQVRGGGALAVLIMAAAAVFVPAALLSAVSPMVVKLRLSGLDETGTVVGRLSGIGTLGALMATFATGFLFVAQAPTSVILLTLGGFLVALGVGLTLALRGAKALGIPLLLALVGAGATWFARPPCDVETAYHCARVVTDPDRPSGRTLRLNTLFHSYVDLADPTYLRFSYVRAMASVIDAAQPDQPLSALHIGGGGLTIPRYLDATRPGTQSHVLEIDPGVVELDIEQLGLDLGDGLEVTVTDARVGLARESTDSRDLVVGDAFGGLSVPWHLTTRETVEDIQRVLRPGGIYTVNVIDYPPLEFARAEIATIAEVFDHLLLISAPDVLQGRDGHNLVIVGSDAALPVEAIQAELAERVPEFESLAGARLEQYYAGAQILTDDFAPVDQLLNPYPQNR
ncbi:MAG: fused MFS/spermidine synthase [Actinomycetota bacterium]